MRQDDPRSVSPEGDNQSCRGNEMMESRPPESFPHSASFRMAGQIAPGLYIWGRKRWEIYTPWPKRTCLSYLLIPGIILPGSSLEEKEREKEEEPSSEMPKQLHCFYMFRPAPLDDRDTSGRGLIHGLHPQWTSSRDGLSLNNREAL